ncbi:MAG: hypothetical protein WBF87_13705 [Mesorhizobium sp.]
MDIISVLGTLVTLLGFAVTIWQVRLAATAAKAAEQAAANALDGVRRFDLIVEFSGLVAVLEEVRRLQRDRVWKSLPERYSQARRLLVSARQIAKDLTDEQRERIQQAVVNFRDMEILLQKAGGDEQRIPRDKMNQRLLEDIDEIIAIFQSLRIRSEGNRNVK